MCTLKYLNEFPFIREQDAVLGFGMSYTVECYGAFDACGTSVPLHLRLRTANDGVFGRSAFHESLFSIVPDVAIRNLLTVAVAVT